MLRARAARRRSRPRARPATSSSRLGGARRACARSRPRPPRRPAPQIAQSAPGTTPLRRQLPFARSGAELGVLVPLVCCMEAEAGHRRFHPLFRRAGVVRSAGSELARSLDIRLASSLFRPPRWSSCGGRDEWIRSLRNSSSGITARWGRSSGGIQRPRSASGRGATNVTLANPLAPPARGWTEVSTSVRRAVSQLGDGEVFGLERISAYSRGDLAYVLEIERFRVKVGGARERAPSSLRVTTIFRREEDGWKVLHRHADRVTTPRPIESVIDQWRAPRPDRTGGSFCFKRANRQRRDGRICRS
jgi:ketosteroid isomerase-like protein